MDSNKLVWFPDSRHGYALGRLVDISRQDVSVQPVAQPSPLGTGFERVTDELEQHVLQFPYPSVYPCDQLHLAATSKNNILLDKKSFNEDDAPDVDDNCALIQLNEAALLENVRLRFHRDKIYTYVAHILIAVNPYFQIKSLHSPEAIASYQGKSLGTMPPHVYAIADKAYRDMKAFKQSQSIIINGESGAGKTESQKYVLRYLCLSGSQSGRLEKLILDANPLLEAFGNAKTIRNNNSSRFGKFIEIHYNNKFIVSGGLFFHYLLEKSRICTQSTGERNYHIFYQLCACLPQEQWQQLQLGPPDQFHYLRNGCTQYFCSLESDQHLGKERKSQAHLQEGGIQDQLIDDRKCYEQTVRALENFGVGAKLQADIYKIVASVLHLGNISFCDHQDDKGGGCRIEPGEVAEQALAISSKLMGLDQELLRQSLVSRIMSTTRGGHKGTVYMVQLSVQQAQAARDALAKAIYSKLFDYIVTKIVNKSIPFTSSSYYIGVLDVAGFEYFQHNSFEQFLINFCNEKLQQFFNERVLKEEQTIYEKEGLDLKRVEFVDNQDCLQLLEAKSMGIFDLLDEESRLPKPSAQHFTQSVHQHNKGHFRLALPRNSKLKSHREIRDDEGFLIRHFAGAVCYQTHSFIDKNNDALHASLKNLMLDAQHELLRHLFTDLEHSSSSAANTPVLQPIVRESSQTVTVSSNKLNFISVGTTFRSQLNNLMGKLRSTGSHFIRCIKPNGEMVAHKFEGGQILSQLHCSGMDSVLELMQQGYPSRSSFNDLYQSYKRLLPQHLARLDSHLFCRALFKALGLSDSDFRFGSSKVFFRPGKFAEFDQIIRSDSEHVAQLVEKVSRWLLCSRWRKAQYCCLSAIKLQNKILYRRQLIISLQKNWRMALVARRVRFRLTALRRAEEVASSLREFKQIASKELKKVEAGERQVIEEQTELLKREVLAFNVKLKEELQQSLASKSKLAQSNEDERARCQEQVERLVTKRDLLVRSIKDKIAKQRELEELERRLVGDNRRRAQEEEAKQRELQMKRQRAELEQRRQSELEAELTSKTNFETHRQPEMVDSGTDPMPSPLLSSQTMREDQERRDYEIALRLAQEQQQPSSMERHGPMPQIQMTTNSNNNKLDLTRWKYSDLRDVINTSCDLDLLEACKREFHRRLKVYHAWRAMNSREGAARAPSSVLAEASRPQLAQDVKLANAGNSKTQATNEQRYFRIPFVKASSSTSTTSERRGWWFAHFDGQWIARQLELHPDREPILLIAGRDDIEMCELSLRETRLTSKRGAEILPQEFEEEWARHGGQAYRSSSSTGNNNVTTTSSSGAKKLSLIS